MPNVNCMPNPALNIIQYIELNWGESNQRRVAN